MYPAHHELESKLGLLLLLFHAPHDMLLHMQSTRPGNALVAMQGDMA